VDLELLLDPVEQGLAPVGPALGGLLELAEEPADLLVIGLEDRDGVLVLRAAPRLGRPGLSSGMV
jgi:hypothetical protein